MSQPPNVIQQQPGFPIPNQENGPPQYGLNPNPAPVAGVPGYSNAPPAMGVPVYPNPSQGIVYPPGYPVPQVQPHPMNPQATVIGMQPMGDNSQGGGWMPAPAANPDCPPGLEYLTMVDQLLVHQQIELLEAFSGFETANKYEVKNSMGQKVFSAGEVSGCCSRLFCGPLRSFEMKLMDNVGREVIHMKRPLACTACCFPCCLQTVEVCSPPGTVIGSIKQDWNIFAPYFAPKFSLLNAAGETVLKIQGPFFTFSCFKDVKFNVVDLDGTKIGRISKQWSGMMREYFTDADNFGISFPMDLDVKMKAVLLGACFLIDYMFFEQNQSK